MNLMQSSKQPVFDDDAVRPLSASERTYIGVCLRLFPRSSSCPGLVPSLLLSTWESGKAGHKNCSAGDARLKVKEDERGRAGWLQSSIAVRHIINSYFSYFGSHNEGCCASLTEIWRAAAISPLPAVTSTINGNFDLKTNASDLGIKVWLSSSFSLFLWKLLPKLQFWRAECLHRKQVRGHRWLKVILQNIQNWRCISPKHYELDRVKPLPYKYCFFLFLLLFFYWSNWLSRWKENWLKCQQRTKIRSSAQRFIIPVHCQRRTSLVWMRKITDRKLWGCVAPSHRRDPRPRVAKSSVAFQRCCFAVLLQFHTRGAQRPSASLLVCSVEVTSSHFIHLFCHQIRHYWALGLVRLWRWYNLTDK